MPLVLTNDSYHGLAICPGSLNINKETVSIFLVWRLPWSRDVKLSSELLTDKFDSFKLCLLCLLFFILFFLENEMAWLDSVYLNMRNKHQGIRLPLDLYLLCPFAVLILWTTPAWYWTFCRWIRLETLFCIWNCSRLGWPKVGRLAQATWAGRSKTSFGLLELKLLELLFVSQFPRMSKFRCRNP